VKKTIGIDIGGTKICAALIQNGHIISDIKSFKTPKTSTEILKTLFHSIEELKKASDIDFVGIATAGAVDIENSRVIGSTGNLPDGYNKLDIKEEIEKKFQLKTFVENDANAAAYAEFKISASKNHQNTIVVTLGTGIGGGIIVNGKLLRGKSGAAAEIGHIQLSWRKERQCTCGTWDCWESYASGTGYAKNACEMAKTLPEFKTSLLQNKNPNEITTYEIIQGYKNSDIFCNLVHERWEQLVLMGLLALSNIFDPESIVLSGGMAQFINFEKLESIINSEVVTTPIKLLHAKAGNHAGMIGAAILAEEKFKEII
jgi:glucokinase